MRFSIANFFTKSPFVLLQTHMDKVEACINELPELINAMEKKDVEKIQEKAKKISKLEHEADLTKNDIRNHLPKSLFMPIDRTTLLNILSLQDSFADKAEDIGVLATLRPLDKFEELKEEFDLFFKKNIATFTLARAVIKEFDTLLETSFGGIEAEKVKDMIEEIAYQEHEGDKLQYLLMKKLYNFKEKDMPFSSVHLWFTIIKEIGSISNYAEKLGNQIRMILELKA
jgi:uncharacterized protein